MKLQRYLSQVVSPNRSVEREMGGKIMTYRTIVDQSNLHHGLELAILDFLLPKPALYLLNKIMI